MSPFVFIVLRGTTYTYRNLRSDCLNRQATQAINFVANVKSEGYLNQLSILSLSIVKQIVPFKEGNKTTNIQVHNYQLN